MAPKPLSGKTGSTKIKPIGQTGGKHFGTDSNIKVVGRTGSSTQDQSKLG